MVAKRALDFDKPTPAKNAKRIKSLARQVNINKGEVKFINFKEVAQITNGNATVIDITAIPEGTSWEERINNEIRVKRVSIIGHVGHQDVDLFLIQSKNATPVTYANFVSCIGGELYYPTYKENFIVWKHHLKTFGANSNINFRKNFAYPIQVQYNAATATACTRNKLLLVLKNNSGANVTPSLYVKVEYYDH